MSNLALFIHINSGCLRSWTSQYDSNVLYKWTETASAALMCICTSPPENHVAFWVTKWDAGLTRCGASACGWNWILEWCWCCCCSVCWERQRRGNRKRRREGGRSTVRKSDRKRNLRVLFYFNYWENSFYFIQMIWKTHRTSRVRRALNAPSSIQLMWFLSNWLVTTKTQTSSVSNSDIWRRSAYYKQKITRSTSIYSSVLMHVYVRVYTQVFKVSGSSEGPPWDCLDEILTEVTVKQENRETYCWVNLISRYSYSPVVPRARCVQKWEIQIWGVKPSTGKMRL